MVTEFKNIKLQ